MKLRCYKKTTTVTLVEIEVADDAPDHKIQYEANTARHLHGQTVVEEREDHWYVKENEDGIPKFGNPFNM
jgi:hypothetical protein